MPRETTQFIPADLSLRQELIIRLLGVAAAAAFVGALEIAVAKLDDKPGTVLSQSVVLVLNSLFGLSLLGVANSLKQHGPSCAEQLSIASTSCGTMIAYGAATWALTSLLNKRYTDFIIEGSTAAFGLCLMSIGLLYQQIHGLHPKTSLLHVMTCKDAPDQRPAVAGSTLGSLVSLPITAYFAYRAGDFGTVAAEAVGTLTSLFFLAKTLKYTADDKEHAFSMPDFYKFAVISIGLSLTIDAIASLLSNRSLLHWSIEGGVGLAFFCLGIAYSCHQKYAAYHDALSESEETPIVVVPATL